MAGVASHSSAEDSSTQLNIVAEGSQWLSMGLSISRPSGISRLLIVMNLLTARHSSLMLSAKGWISGFIGRLLFSAQCCKHQQ